MLALYGKSDCFRFRLLINTVGDAISKSTKGIQAWFAPRRNGAVLRTSITSGRLQGMVIKAIVHESEEGGIWAEVPALPGCVTQGDTIDEIQANLREAIELWLSIDDSTIDVGSKDKVLELSL